MLPMLARNYCRRRRRLGWARAGLQEAAATATSAPPHSRFAAAAAASMGRAQKPEKEERSLQPRLRQRQLCDGALTRHPSTSQSRPAPYAPT